MPEFPPIPTWTSLHPMIVHFPIVLLLLSPVFLLISAVSRPPHGKPYRTVALILLLAGAGSLFLTAFSGQAAAKLVNLNGPVKTILDSHKELAIETGIVFAVLSVILLGIVILPRMLGCEETRLATTWMPLSFLVLYCAGVVLIVNTAHAGARLVHEFGAHAIIPAKNNQSSEPLPAAETADMGEPR